MTRRRVGARCLKVTAAFAAVTFAFGLCAAPALAAAKGQWSFVALNVAKAWQVSRGAGVTVAVVDSGVVGTLGDLRGRVQPGINLSGSGSADGQSDPGQDCSGPGGCVGSGTNLALNIAGTGAGAGFTGIAPQASILPVKVTARSGDAPDPDKIAEGIRWAVDHGAQIIAVGVGTQGLCPAVEDEAGKYAYEHGVPILVAAGDDGGKDVNSPAGCYGAMGVTAVDTKFQPAPQGNYGFTATFCAPGVDIAAETLNGTIRQNTSGSVGATGIVAGTFALVRASFPTLDERDLITRVLWNVHNGGTKLGQFLDERLGYGEVLPYYALTYHLPSLQTLANPVFDAWKKDLGPPATTGAPTVSPSTGSSDTAASSPSASSPPSSLASASSAPAASGSSSSGTSAGIIVLLVVLVVVAVGGGTVIAVRSRRTRSGPQ